MKLPTICILLATVSCAGPEGPVGQPGAQGQRGPPGPPGADGTKLTAQIHCTGIANVDPSRGLIVGFTHDAYLFSDGSVMTYCEVGTGGVGGSGFAIYTSKQAGAANAGCTLKDDLDGPTSGFWSFSMANAATSFPSTQATYTDAGSQYNAYTYSFSCTKAQ